MPMSVDVARDMMTSWRAIAAEAAWGGAQAIRDSLIKYGQTTDVVIDKVEVSEGTRHLPVPNLYVKISLVGGQVFDMRTPKPDRRTDAPWADVVTSIEGRQLVTPAHLRGLPHNADEATTRALMAKIAADTGYDVRPGDFWVRICDGSEIAVGGPFSPPPHVRSGFAKGSVVYGYLTKSGALAARKLAEQSIEAETTAPARDRATKAILQDWANLQGHDRCHWHPEVLEKLCHLHGITPMVPITMPPRSEFEQGCKRFADQEYAVAGTIITPAPAGSETIKISLNGDQVRLLVDSGKLSLDTIAVGLGSYEVKDHGHEQSN